MSTKNFIKIKLLKFFHSQILKNPLGTGFLLIAMILLGTKKNCNGTKMGKFGTKQG